jgi:hypothetical protein
MKIINPSLNEIIDYFYTHGQCSIMLKNGHFITGDFTSQHKPDSVIIGWNLKIIPHNEDFYVSHDDIQYIERTD